jgi:hypothetical protein
MRWLRGQAGSIQASECIGATQLVCDHRGGHGDGTAQPGFKEGLDAGVAKFFRASRSNREPPH